MHTKRHDNKSDKQDVAKARRQNDPRLGRFNQRKLLDLCTFIEVLQKVKCASHLNEWWFVANNSIIIAAATMKLDQNLLAR